ncbi:MAG: glycoside hydrolase family 31 protein, partial [bacterium]|nr:glycoside hydrolase family 31 protein [bacterium]
DYDKFPEPEEMCASLKEKHLHISLWINPYIWLQTGTAHEHRDVLLRDKSDDIVFTPMSTQQAIYDFTRREAREFFGDELRKLLRMGIDLFKTDYGENIPEEAVFSSGETGIYMHNLYPYLFNRLVYNVSREVKGTDAIVWSRSGFAGSQLFPVCWSGDSQSTWDAAAHVLSGGLSAALSGIPFWSCDIGGFVGLPGGLSEELYIRWAQFGLLLSHARFHGTNGPREPWHFSPRTYEIVKKFAELRYRLITYLYNLGIEAGETGMPVIRPMVLEFEDDPACYSMSDQYMLGSALLIKPVLKPGVDKISVYLPKGRWRDFFSGKIYAGPGYVELETDIESIPMLQRQGTIIPLNEAMEYVDEAQFGKFQLLVFDCDPKEYAFFRPGAEEPLSIKIEYNDGFNTIDV